MLSLLITSHAICTQKTRVICTFKKQAEGTEKGVKRRNKEIVRARKQASHGKRKGKRQGKGFGRQGKPNGKAREWEEKEIGKVRQRNLKRQPAR